MTGLEESIINSFILPNRKERYLSLLNARGGRDKIRHTFPHFRDFDPRFIVSIPHVAHRADDVELRLRERGAPRECYIWSESSSLDDRSISLQEALLKIIGWTPGTILLCVPGRLGYYEGEDENERFILAR